MVAAKVVNPRNRRFKISSKLIRQLLLIVCAVWVVLFVGYWHVSTLDNSYPSLNDYDPTTLKVMTWNMLGFQSWSLKERAGQIVKTIIRENVDAALLQEMTPSWSEVVCKDLRGYFTCIRGKNVSNVILYKKFRFDYKSDVTIPIKNTSVPTDRGLLKVELSLKSNKSQKVEIALLDTHLDPDPSNWPQRINQFNECIRYGNYPENVNVIFGGDLNLEDNDNSKLDMDDFKDVWNMCGSSESIRYTWDTVINPLDRDALKTPGRKPKARYDRLYFLSSKPKTLEPIKLKLGGKEKVEGIDSFVSDHFALIATFKIVEGEDAQYSCNAS